MPGTVPGVTMQQGICIILAFKEFTQVHQIMRQVTGAMRIVSAGFEGAVLRLSVLRIQEGFLEEVTSKWRPKDE